VVGAIAVGNLSFVEKLKSELRFKAAHPAALRRFNGDLAWSDPWRPIYQQRWRRTNRKS
jgi:hypothetical protein